MIFDGFFKVLFANNSKRPGQIFFHIFIFQSNLEKWNFQMSKIKAWLSNIQKGIQKKMHIQRKAQKQKKSPNKQMQTKHRWNQRFNIIFGPELKYCLHICFKIGICRQICFIIFDLWFNYSIQFLLVKILEGANPT